MRRKLIYAVLAAVAAGAALYLLFPKPSGPVLLSTEIPVSDGTRPLPPGTTVMPRIEPVFDEVKTIDMEKESAKFRAFFQEIRPSTTPAESPATTKKPLSDPKAAF